MKPRKSARIFQTKSFSLPPDLIEFVLKRGAQVGGPSDYIQKLIRHDQEENILGEIAKKQAERLSTPVAA